ncbi:ABC transporter ATP-binding protein [Campylobacter sp. MIT 12-8780]|uniref:ATP-binding cassette domain-containing protein n=1 Tax=unclassified Campylobacter TaxID=2593542 RepID=UPI00115DD688|nr:MULTISPECIES: ATP-binding cassette domain-containing protein [unclassified Campylobacter]NDJ27755.1 ABC transporter ATP-binding protein [Campylobacter sp. MIT 19-121]TQR41039.1 ABC transporter ATP-binding protein [Campylobacter sp. MIT 12-8780]
MICCEKLNVCFQNKALLKDISFHLKEHEILGIIGKSGSGKSLLAKSLIKLLDKNLSLNAKKCEVNSFDILQCKNLQDLRSQVAYIFQDSKASFHPFLDIGRYFEICLKTHTQLTSKKLKELAFIYFDACLLKDKERIWHSMPYQLSGGMAMRVQFALALACGAKVLICDELTSSLDQKNIDKISQILNNIKNNTSLILISHDLDFIKQLSDKIIVLEKGEIVEQGLKADFFQNPQSLYARELLKLYERQICF